MYDTWGGTSRILGARGLRKKLSPLEGFRPPTHYVVWVGEPDYGIPCYAGIHQPASLASENNKGYDELTGSRIIALTWPGRHLGLRYCQNFATTFVSSPAM